MEMVDLFAPPMVGDREYVRPSGVFPADLSAPEVRRFCALLVAKRIVLIQNQCFS